MQREREESVEVKEEPRERKWGKEKLKRDQGMVGEVGRKRRAVLGWCDGNEG